MKVLILSGLPGCGKSTYAEGFRLHTVTMDTVICSADKFHVDGNGQYKFNPLKAAEAHDSCLGLYIDCFQYASEIPYLIVDNTNTTAWEIAPYYRLAELYKIPVEIVRWICPVEKSIKRNTHDVPIPTIVSMYNNLMNDKLPPRWKISYRVTE